MKRIFIVVGIATVALGVLTFLFMLPQPIAAVITLAGALLSGSLLIAVGDLLARVEYLEAQLGISAADPSESDLPKKTCPACGKKYDFDYPTCPHCGAAGD